MTFTYTTQLSHHHSFIHPSIKQINDKEDEEDEEDEE